MRDKSIDAQQQTWGHTWREFLNYAQRGDRGREANENVRMSEETIEANDRGREPYPTFYPREVVGATEDCEERGCPRKNMERLTVRARNNKHRQEQKDERHK
eukprot:6214177-Pleurochrysis_carterae.AAC.6